MAVLKANAYGLGVRAIAKALKDEGIHAFGLAEPKEAAAIADLGIPTLVLGGLLPEEIPRITSYNVCYTKLLRVIDTCGQGLGKPEKDHVQHQRHTKKQV